MSKGISRRLRERYGGMVQLKSQNGGIGDVAYLISSITIYQRSRLITEKEPLTLNDTEALYGSTCKLRELMISNRRHRLAIPYIPTYNWNLLEKILETLILYIYVSTDMRRPTLNKRRSHWFQKANIVNLRTVQGKAYAELLRSIRKDVNLDNINDDVLLEEKKGKAAEPHLTIIDKQMHGFRAMMMTKEPILYVRELDGITNKKKIIEAVTKAIDAIRSRKVTSLRPAYGGTQNATVILDPHAAEQLKKLGSIIVGLVQCECKFRTKKDNRYAKWKFRPGREEAVAEVISSIVSKHQKESQASIPLEKSIAVLRAACKQVLLRSRGGTRRVVYWWNDEMGRLRSVCLSSKMKLLRANSKPNTAPVDRSTA
nr:unnamed protein product [Callosobruchus chinensis]